MNPHRRLLFTLWGLALLLAACGTSATTTVAPTSTTAAATGDVLEVAASEPDLGVFLSALEAAGIMEDFHGQGPFTLFVPTDDAFATYMGESGMTQDEVFAGAEMLQGILNYHVVSMMDDAEMVMGMDGESFTTASGQPLQVTVEGDTVRVGEATILRYDLQASNGVIHVIDKVLIPEGA